MEHKPSSMTNLTWHLKAKNIVTEDKKISYLSWGTRGYVATLWSICKEERKMLIDKRDMTCGESRNNSHISFVTWMEKILWTCFSELDQFNKFILSCWKEIILPITFGN